MEPTISSYTDPNDLKKAVESNIRASNFDDVFKDDEEEEIEFDRKIKKFDKFDQKFDSGRKNFGQFDNFDDFGPSKKRERDRNFDKNKNNFERNDNFEDFDNFNLQRGSNFDRRNQFDNSERKSFHRNFDNFDNFDDKDLNKNDRIKNSNNHKRQIPKRKSFENVDKSFEENPMMNHNMEESSDKILNSVKKTNR